MLRVRLLILLVIALWASAATGASAAPAPRADVATTSRYLADASNLFRTLIARRPEETGGADAVARAVSVHCRAAVPLSLRTGTPAQQRIWTALVINDPMVAVTLAALRPVRRAYRVAARALERLRWSDPRLTRAVTADARRALAVSALPIPDLCADVRAAAALGFTSVPREVTRLTARFSRALRDSDAAPGFGIPTGQLGRTLIAADRPRVRALRALQARFDRGLYRMIFVPWAHTLTALHAPLDRP